MLGERLGHAELLDRVSSANERKSGVGMPASRIRCLASALSVQRMHAPGPEPV